MTHSWRKCRAFGSRSAVVDRLDGRCHMAASRTPEASSFVLSAIDRSRDTPTEVRNSAEVQGLVCNGSRVRANVTLTWLGDTFW